MVFQMGKTLVIAEKPSVGRDLSSALEGVFQRRKLEDVVPKRTRKKTAEEAVDEATTKPSRSRTREDVHFLESDDYVITWAVGHLVQLADPEEYDEKWKRWRMADLPIVPPNGFKLVPRDAKSKKQLKLVETLLKRDDVDRVINACDAGREGELIFAYLYESVFGESPSVGGPKPVDRLWISSMTKQAIREGFEKLRPGDQMHSLEAAARSRSEADWLVGMNATRAATIRGRAWVGGVVSLGRVQTPTAETLRPIQDYRTAAEYVLALDQLPLARVVNDAKVEDHHAIIPTDIEHDVEDFTPDERRVFDLVARRFLAAFHPPARYARTTVITVVEEERFRTRGKVTLEAGWRGVYGVEPDHERQLEDESEGGEIPALQEGQTVRCIAAELEDKMTRPPPRYTEATLLSAMETAGKLIDDEELREAMKDSGLGTPATRAETIETLIRREYIERVGRDLQATPKGIQVVTMLEEHKLTSPELTGDWEHKLADIERGRGDREAFMKGLADLAKATVEQIAALDKEQLRPERVELGLCPRCGVETGEIIKENSKAYGCTSWKSREEVGCGFVIWKRVASRTLTPEIARQLIEERRTREVLSGFRSRNGKPFRARLVLNDEDKIEFEFPVRAQSKEPAATE